MSRLTSRVLRSYSQKVSRSLTEPMRRFRSHGDGGRRESPSCWGQQNRKSQREGDRHVFSAVGVFAAV